MTALKTARNARPAPTAGPVDKTRQLQITAKKGTTVDRALADVVAQGIAMNADTAIAFVRHSYGDVALTDLVASLKAEGEAVNRGDLSNAERMLNAQALTLNTIFNEMARRAALNMGEHLAATETYMRLALKAQSQSRATVETLAAIKNPPVVFAKQMNVANGPQQVNNGTAAPGKPESSRTEEKPFQQNELLGALTDERTQVDTRTAPATGRKNPELVPVEAINRAPHR